MAGSRHGIAHDDHSIDQQGLDDGHYGGLLAAAGIAGGRKSGANLAFGSNNCLHITSILSKFTHRIEQFVKSLGPFKAEVLRGTK